MAYYAIFIMHAFYFYCWHGVAGQVFHSRAKAKAGKKEEKREVRGREGKRRREEPLPCCPPARPKTREAEAEEFPSNVPCLVPSSVPKFHFKYRQGRGREVIDRGGYEVREEGAVHEKVLRDREKRKRLEREGRR